MYIYVYIKKFSQKKKDFSPTAAQNCTNGTLRLVNGSLESAGRVEICINGVWGTVCSYYYYFDYRENDVARVVCRQLGYNVNPGRGEILCTIILQKSAHPSFWPNFHWSDLHMAKY